MKMKPLIVYSLSAFAVLVGCAERPSDTPQTLDPRPIEIQSQVDTQPASKGVATNATPLEKMQFLRKDAATAPTGFANVTAVEGDRDTYGMIAFATPQNYSVDNSKAYFVAYYPAGTASAGSSTAWNIDGTTDILLSPIYHAGQYTAPYSDQAMVFNHVLAKLCVKIVGATGANIDELRNYYGMIKSINLHSSPTTATYTYATNQITISSNLQIKTLLQRDCQTAFTPIEIPTADNTQINAAGMYAPAASNIELAVVTENRGTLIVPNVLTFDAGKEHTITITFSAVEAAAAVSNITITQWSEGYTHGTEMPI